MYYFCNNIFFTLPKMSAMSVPLGDWLADPDRVAICREGGLVLGVEEGPGGDGPIG